MQFDLDSMSRQELVKLRNEVEKAISSLAERERRRALDAAEKAAAEHGFSLADLAAMSSGKGRGRKSTAAAKYRNPEDANQTWSGRGRRPDWVNAALAAGASLGDLAI